MFLTSSDGQLIWNRINENYDIAFNNKTGELMEFTGDPQHNREELLANFPSLKPEALDE